MADVLFEYPVSNYKGGFAAHPNPERRGTLTFMSNARWELSFPKKKCWGGFARYPLSIISSGRHGCQIMIRDLRNPRDAAQFDLPGTDSEQLLRDLSSFMAGISSLPKRSWPMTEIINREPVAVLAERLVTPIVESVNRCLAKWSPNHVLRDSVSEASEAMIWGQIYGLLGCAAEWQPMTRDQILERTRILARHQPPPDKVIPSDLNAAVASMFTFSEIERLGFEIGLTHADATISVAISNSMGTLVKSGICALDSKMTTNSAAHAAMLRGWGAFRSSLARDLKFNKGTTLKMLAQADLVVLPPIVQTPTRPEDLGTWWVQVVGEAMPVKVEVLFRQAPVRSNPTVPRAAPAKKANKVAMPIEGLLGKVDELIGLGPVKKDVRQLINMVRVEQMRRSAGLPVTQMSRHLVFTGNPGTGKTTVARLLGQLYAAIGILRTGQLIEVSRADLVAGYVGQTAIKTSKAVEEALGGILFIDEAYSLVRPSGSSQDFGQEAVDTLVKLMEDHRDDLVVIAAGYNDEMAQLVGSNPGLASRFPKTVHFLDYSPAELTLIFKGMCERDQYAVSERALESLHRFLAGIPRSRDFGNGRFVRNIFEAALVRQANRIVANSGSDLSQLTIDDLGIPERPGS